MKLLIALVFEYNKKYIILLSDYIIYKNMVDILHHNIKSHGDIRLNSRAGDITLNTPIGNTVLINSVDINTLKPFADYIDINHSFDNDTNIFSSSYKSLVKFNQTTILKRYYLQVSSLIITMEIDTIPESFNVSLKLGTNGNTVGFTISNPTLTTISYTFPHELTLWNYDNVGLQSTDLNYLVIGVSGKITSIQLQGLLEASNPINLSTTIEF